jgi:hypothetical protein
MGAYFKKYKGAAANKLFDSFAAAPICILK